MSIFQHDTGPPGLPETSRVASRPSDLQRRYVRLFALVPAFLYAVFAWVNWMGWASVGLMSVCVLASLLALSGYWLVARSDAWVTLGAHLVVVAVTVQTVGSMYFSGGFEATVTPTLILIVPCAIFLAGLGALLPWTLVVLLILVGFAILTGGELLPRSEIPDDKGRLVRHLITYSTAIMAGSFLGLRLMRMIRDSMTRLDADRKRFQYDATHDALTGLSNRADFFDRAASALMVAKDRLEYCTLLYIDLDGFKQINDSMGHEAGDALLVAFGRWLAARFGESDLVARLAGDEFVVLVGNCGQQGSERHVIDRVASIPAEAFRIQDRSLTIGASIGAAVFPRDADSLERLLHIADQAMYRDKESRRPARQSASVLPINTAQRAATGNR